MRWVCTCVVAGLLLWSPWAWAWTGLGHRLVVRLAQPALTPATQAALFSLLSHEPGATLESLSTWADDHRDPATAAWHYVNFPRGECRYVPERDCPDGLCVVAALQRQLAVLASDAPAQARLLALKYVTHLAADIHQPLHAGFADDRGGNRYPLQVAGVDTNLHALWDAGLGQLSADRLTGLEARLVARMRGEPLPPRAPHAVAEASCRIVSEPAFYPALRVSEDHFQRYGPVVERQLLGAAQWLAVMLNGTLGGRH